MTTWTVSVAGRSYGPYAHTQLQSFVAEGRLTRQSLVAPTGTDTLAPAGSFSELSDLFQPAQQQTTQLRSPRPDVPSFGRGDRTEAQKTERGQFIVVADLRSGSVSTFEQELFGFGPTFTVLPNIWILSAEVSLNVLRNALVQKLGRLDVLFLVDATHNKAAWFNFGPEAEARIRRIWTRSQDTTLQRAAG